MRKLYILSFLFLFSAFSLYGNDLYWVGGSGDWNDLSHWSSSSGGTAAYQLPNENTNVIIDQESLMDGDAINITSDVSIYAIVFTNKKAYSFSVKDGILIHIAKSWEFEKNSKASFNFNVSVISLTNEPDFNKVSKVTGGAFLINGVHNKWDGDKWEAQNMFKSGHVPVATVTNPLCNGGLGSAVGSVIGGTGPFQYFWTGGTLGTNIIPGNPINNIGAGTYTLIVFDLSDGSNETINFVVTEPSVINAFFLSGVPTCVGFNDGSLTANIFGGTPGTTDYNVAWSSGLNESGVTSSTATNLVAGPYNVVITDSNGCQVTRYDTLLDPAPVLANAVVTNLSCNGINDGAISTSASSGNGGPYTYAWLPDGETTSFISMKPAGIYTLHIEDVNSCTFDTSITIIEPLVLAATITSITHLLCNGDCTPGEAIVTPTGGTFPYTYQWLDSGNNPIAGYTDSTASTLCAGTYSVSVTDANLCNIVLTNIVINEPAPFVTVSNSTPAICNGDANGSVVVTPSGGTSPYYFFWYTNPGGVLIGTDSLEIGLEAGNYDYLVFDSNNCLIIGNETIAEPDTIGFDLTKIDLQCNGDIDGQAVIFNVAGGDGNFTYLWQDAGMNTIGTGLSVSNLIAGNYTITVSDGNNCSTTLPFEIIEPLAISLILSADSVSCNGLLDGEVHVIASGGVVAVDYSYDWRDALNIQVGTSADVTGLPSGTYTVTVTDDNNCSEVASIDVFEPLAIAIIGTIGHVTCNGDMDGFINLTVSGGSPSYNYAWTGPNGFVSSNQNINGLEGGTYTITLSDANNCSLIQNYIVNEPPAIVFVPTIIDITCFGAATGSIQVNVSGGNGGFLYDWRDAGNTQISITDEIINVVAGDYTLNVTDAIGCTHSETYTINEFDDINANAVVTPVTCFNDFDGAIDIFPSGGVPNYSYAWTGPNGFNSINQNILNLEAGTYDLTITDQNLCTLDTSIIIANPPAIIISETINHVTCSGDMDGSIDVLINGGIPPYVIGWTGPNGFVSTDQNISNLEGGTYTITVSDANFCVTSIPYIVNEPLAITFVPIIVDVACSGNSTGSIQVTVSGGNGGYIYDWRDIGNNQISTTDAIVNVGAGDYTLNVTDPLGCFHSETYTINESSEIFINADVTDITCFNANDGNIDINPTGGVPAYTFAWAGPNGFNSISQNISNLEAGVYDLTLTDQNLCTKDTSITIVNPPTISISETIGDVTCSGDMDGFIDVIINGGVLPYTIGWTGPNGFVSTDQNISNLEGGTYTITVTDGNNCVLSIPYVVDEPMPLVFVPAITHVSCFGELTGSIQVIVSGGNGGLLYDWRDDGNNQISTSDAIVNVGAGDYTLNVIDALGCMHSETYTINENAEIFFNADISIISCFDADDGAIDLNPTGGTPNYTYAWVGPNGFNSISQNISNLEDGVYDVTISDQNFCTKDTSITLINPAPIVITETIIDVDCNGAFSGEISLSISGGTIPFVFDWTGPNGFVSNDQNIIGLEAGDYTVIVTDAALCNTTETYTVDEPLPISIVSSITHVECKNDSTGSIQIIAGGGAGDYIYEWRDALNNIISVTDEIIDVPAGDYTILVTDSSNCSYSETLTITEPLQAISLTLSALDIDCFGDNTGAVAVAISGGTIITPADYVVEWLDATNTLIGTTQIVSDLIAGMYYVSVMDLNNCIAIDSIEVIENTEIILNEIASDALCNGEATGNASVAPTGGSVASDYTYEWENVLSPGVIISTSNSINDVAAGDYLITVYDDNACFGFVTVTIGEPSPMLVTFSIIEPLCNGDLGGQILADVSGGTVLADYIYEWQDNLGNTIGTNALITGISGGDYVFFAWDDNDCEVQIPVSINEAEALSFIPTIQQIECAGIDDGEISVNVNGGTLAYQYEWTDGSGNVISNDTIISNLAADDYTFTVIDANGCTLSETYTISALNTIDLTFTQYELGDCSINPPCIAAAFVIASGGTGVYVNYQWLDQFGNDIGINNDTATALCSGSYQVIVTDSDNCSGTILVFINDQDAEDIVVETQDPLCNGELGTAIAQYVCIDAPCNIEWFNAIGNLSLGLTSDTVQLAAGEYFVLITNATGCTNRVLFTIDEPNRINPNESFTPASCDGICDGSASVNPSGGMGPYTYLWNDPMAQNTPTAIDLCAGDYEVIITDVNLCDTTVLISVTSPSSLIVNETITHVNCQDGNDGSIDLVVSDGSGLYTYTWNPIPPIGNGTSNGSGMSAGDYEITIEDVLNPGCLLIVNYTIDQPDSLLATLSSVESTCNTDDGGASVIVSGGTPDYTYLWNDPAAQNTATATGLFAGIYTVTVTDDNLCTEDFSIAVNDALADTLSLTILPGLCPGDSSLVSAIYDCTNPICVITWYDEDTNPLPLTGDIVTLATGSYWVGIENGFGCEFFLPFVIDGINPIEPNLTISSETCNDPCDGSATIDPIGGSGNYTITWSPEPPTGQGTTSVSGLCPGTWQVVIVDEIGCDTTVTFEILEYTAVSGLISTTDASCNGDDSGTAQVQASGGQEPYTYTWSPEPGSGQGNPNVGGLFAGDWMLTIADVNGCDTTLTFSILEPSLMEADSVVVNASCNTVPGDGSIDLIVSGGSAPYSYQWFDADGIDLNVNTAFIGNLGEGIYQCIVSDDSLCTQTFVAIVSEIDGESITSGSVDVTCYGGNDGMAWVEYVCGDSPCSVNWYDEFGNDLGFTSDTIVDLIAGSYIVSVTNATGCISYLNIVVDESSEILVDFAINDATCSGICDGSAVASVSGGTGNYTYLWIPEPESGQGTASASGLCAGDWMLLVSDDLGCVDTTEFVINEAEQITSNLVTSDETCELGCDGWASVAPVGGSGNYTYLWIPEPDFGQGTDSAYGLCAGDWSVLITDDNAGCNITEMFTISQLNPIFITDTLITHPECENDNSGSITITAGGGIPPLTYQWLDNNLDPIAGETDSTISGLFPGAYFIVISDDFGCTHSEVFVLIAESDLVADAGADTTYCQGGGPATFIGSGNGISSIWTDIFGNVLSVGDTLIIDAPVGNIGYIYQTSDGICTALDTAYAIVMPAPFSDAGEDQEIFVEESVMIGGDPTGPDGSIYTWSPSETLSDTTDSNPIAAPLVTTSYVVIVELDNGCIGSDTTTVIVNPKFVPNNGFTPNGDGKNDVWVIGNLSSFPNVEVSIFNRWGQQLFTSKGYADPWDGRYDGKDVPVGTYYYVIDLKDEMYPDAFTGPLTIMR